MNEYEAKQEERRQRYLDRAQKAEAASNSHSGRAREMLEHIPPGQPILVGHHSERRHRRDLARSDAQMRKAVDAHKKAEYYRQKAAGVGRAGISADDPEAIEKLSDKLARLEEWQETMKRVNREYKEGGMDAVQGLTDKQRKRAEDTLRIQPYYGKPFPPYELQNNGANIRRIKERIANMEEVDQTVDEAPVEYEGFTLVESARENRIMFEFPGKPAPEVRTILKAHSFKWSPSRGAWVRQITPNARYAAQQVVKQLNA